MKVFSYKKHQFIFGICFYRGTFSIFKCGHTEVDPTQITIYFGPFEYFIATDRLTKKCQKCETYMEHYF